MAVNEKSLFIGDVIRLVGVNRHGKNRIRENGDLWEITNMDGAESSILTTKICVRPIMEGRTDNWRWIDLPEDEHMEIVEIIDNEVVI